MTFGNLREFFKPYLNGLGLREWPDGFNYSNIPSSVINKSYHVSIGPISGNPGDMLTHAFTAPVTIRVFLKGFRQPCQGIDKALEIGYEILETLLRPDVRLTQGCLKDITPGSVTPVQLNPDNDNTVMLEVNLDLELIYCFKNI